MRKNFRRKTDVRPPEEPRFALVVWPYNRIGIVALNVLDSAVKRGAIIIANEANILPFNPPRIVERIDNQTDEDSWKI